MTLPPQEASVFNYIAEQEHPVLSSTIQKALNLNPGTVSGALARLKKKQLIDNKPNPVPPHWPGWKHKLWFKI